MDLKLAPEQVQVGDRLRLDEGDRVAADAQLRDGWACGSIRVFRISALAALLAVNAVVHGIVVARFGIRHHNEPFFVFALVNAASAIAVFRVMPHALWAVLLLSLIGLIGLSVTFNKPVRAKNLDRLIWLQGAAAIFSAGFLLFVGHSS